MDCMVVLRFVVGATTTEKTSNEHCFNNAAGRCSDFAKQNAGEIEAISPTAFRIKTGNVGLLTELVETARRERVGGIVVFLGDERPPLDFSAS